MSKSKGVQRSRLADMSQAVFAPQDDPRWSPDPEDLTDDYPVNMPIAGAGRIYGRQTLDRESGRLVAFGFSAQIERDGCWHSIGSADTDHEEVPLHRVTKSGKKVDRRIIRIIRGPQDVHHGWVDAVNALVDSWEEFVRRWSSGR